MAERKKIINIKKAGIHVCLFVSLSFAWLPLRAQDWQFTPRVQRAYDLTLDLQFDKALASLPNPATAQEYYVTSLTHALNLVLTEDGENYEIWYEMYENRLEKRTKSSLPEDLFLQAELRLQWAFVLLKFGKEFDAAWNLRQAYLNAKDCRERFPDFVPVRKTVAILDILIGSVPEKYNWVLGLMGMKGSLQRGMKALNTLRTTDNTMKTEADMLYAVVQGFVLQNPDSALAAVHPLLKQKPGNRLLNLLGGALSIKAARSDAALAMLNKLNPRDTTYLHFVSYLKGEVYLHKADYKNAINEYRWFVNNYKGQHYIKDAWYKTGLCYFLAGDTNDALENFKQARTRGREDTEADKYAARALAFNHLPHRDLSRVRYYTDGGYYNEARAALDSIRPSQLPSQHDKSEYQYRYARLAHKTGDEAAAKKYYEETIRSCGDEPWYFAPNACLQMGYILLHDGDTARARDYFIKARKYPRHEYKNSIDSKAKSALAGLR